MNIATTEHISELDAIRKLPEAEQKAARAEMINKGEFLVNRMILGKGRNKSAFVSLKDAKGRERLQISVAADGTSKINFLDETGKVTYSLPDISNPTKK